MPDGTHSRVVMPLIDNISEYQGNKSQARDCRVLLKNNVYGKRITHQGACTEPRIERFAHCDSAVFLRLEHVSGAVLFTGATALRRNGFALSQVAEFLINEFGLDDPETARGAEAWQVLPGHKHVS